MSWAKVTETTIWCDAELGTQRSWVDGVPQRSCSEMFSDAGTVAEIRDRARAYYGWAFRGGKDLCPQHAEEG